MGKRVQVAEHNGDHAKFLSSSNVSTNKRRHRRLCLPQSGAMPCVIVTVGPIGRSIYTALLVQSRLK